jgi:hypothetical protein
MVVLSDKAARFHPRHIVLKLTQSNEFEMPIRCEWISHRPLPSSKSDFLLLLSVVVCAGAHGGSWPLTDLSIQRHQVCSPGVNRKWSVPSRNDASVTTDLANVQKDVLDYRDLLAERTGNAARISRHA